MMRSERNTTRGVHEATKNSRTASPMRSRMIQSHPTWFFQQSNAGDSNLPFHLPLPLVLPLPLQLLTPTLFHVVPQGLSDTKANVKSFLNSRRVSAIAHPHAFPIIPQHHHAVLSYHIPLRHTQLRRNLHHRSPSQRTPYRCPTSSSTPFPHHTHTESPYTPAPLRPHSDAMHESAKTPTQPPPS
ncbi:hypothetical protein BJ165DRAFT_1503490 [Panaeolus papilionaceus]|nr:hypothetical protein BJ165DRAFT_1503490 [Panaeolus papilionaceus]